MAEVNALAPKRSKGSDGWLGDASHASRASRHNPNNAGVVCAQDITHDPKGGCDIHAIAEAVRLRYHDGHPTNPCFEYVISNGRVASRSSGWKWKTYTGANQHDKHAHFAVGRGPDSEPTAPYDDRTPWGVASPTEEDDMDIPKLVKGDQKIEWYKFDGLELVYVPTKGHAAHQYEMGMLQSATPETHPQSFVDELLATGARQVDPDAVARAVASAVVADVVAALPKGTVSATDIADELAKRLKD
jgi:hypothetical protein